MSAAIETVEQSLEDLREQRKVIVEELRIVDKLIDGQAKALSQVKPKEKAKPTTQQTTIKPAQHPSTKVTNIASKRATKSAAPNKGGRPTKRAEFMKWLREHKEIARERIPTTLNTSVQKVNEFVPELVRDELVTLEDRGDKHDPTEFVVITEKGQNA